MVALIVWLSFVVLSIAVSLLTILSIRKPMNELLKANSYISPARKFYLRSFALIIFLATLAVIVSIDELCEEQSRHFMEGIWWIFDNLGPVLWIAILSVGAYTLLLTILFAVLGRYHDE
jgi:hypothetical protein